MNIMKTDLLLLDNKIMKKDADGSIMAPVPAPVENPEAGMNALMFKGVQNLMANPALSKEIGVSAQETTKNEKAQSYVAPFSSNVAFKSGKSKVMTMAAGVLAAAALSSCTVKFPESEPTKNTLIAIQKQDNTAVVAAITALQLQIAELQRQMAERDAAQAQREEQMIAALNSAITVLNNVSATLLQMKEDQQMGREELRALLLANNAALLDAIAILNNTSKENAESIVDAILTSYENGTILFSDVMNAVQELLGQLIKRLDANFETLFARDDENKVLINKLIEEAKAGNVNLQTLIGEANTIINNQKEEKEAIININNDINKLNGNITYSREKLIKALECLGYTFAQYSSWNTDRMIAVIRSSVTEQNEVIKANGEKIDSLSEQLKEIIRQHEQGLINDEQALELLASIDQGIKDLNGKADALISLVKSFKSDLNAIKNTTMSISYNTGMTAYGVYNLNNQFKNLNKNVVDLKAIAIQVRDELANGVSIDDSRIIAALEALGLDVNAGKTAIINKLNEFIPELQEINTSINKLDNNNQAKLEYVANLIKNVTPDNKDLIAAIADLKNSNETNIAASTEKLAEKLDALIAKVAPLADKIDNVSANITVYGNDMSDKFNKNNNYLDQILNSIKSGKADLEQIVPLLKQMNGNIVIGDNYLEQISKKQLPELEEAINNISNIGGGLTKAELQDALKDFGIDLNNTFGAYFVKNNDQNDEIIDLLKKANGLQKDTYNAIIDASNRGDLNAEKLEKLVTAIKNYLPELKHECHLQCNCPTIEQLEELIKKYKKANEEIIGVLN